MYYSFAILRVISKRRCHESLGHSTLVILAPFPAPLTVCVAHQSFAKTHFHFSKHRVVLNTQCVPCQSSCHSWMTFYRFFLYFLSVSWHRLARLSYLQICIYHLSRLLLLGLWTPKHIHFSNHSMVNQPGTSCAYIVDMTRQLKATLK
jgi:hypothetical protein